MGQVVIAGAVALGPGGVAALEGEHAQLTGERRGGPGHAAGDEGDAVRGIAGVIGRRLGLPVEAVPAETYGALGPIFATDQPSSSVHTRQELGWKPVHPSLLADLENIQP
ncbi:hypothetical protein ACQPZX_33530 [Actinoplanes sp. CA-142083]|uniref:hypothetical protein n=1 Tax=Actinoplanes sp. CA-142083 TaxID=3239903 RepID=UPI003D9367CB